jgi:hypothetical protein
MLKAIFKKMLRTILFAPLIPIIGVPDDGGSNGGGSASNADNGNSSKSDEGKNSPSGDKGGNSDNKNSDKTHSQADVDKIVQKRVADEQKKHQKAIGDLKAQLDKLGNPEGAGAGQAGQPQGTTIDPAAQQAAQQAQAVLTAANQRLVSATATTEAIKLGADPKYVADVVKLADLGNIEVKEDGSVDDGAIAKAVGEVLKRIPNFKMTTTNSGGFKVGGEGQQNPKQNGWDNNQQSQQQQTTKKWNRFN